MRPTEEVEDDISGDNGVIAVARNSWDSSILEGIVIEMEMQRIPQ